MLITSLHCHYSCRLCTEKRCPSPIPESLLPIGGVSDRDIRNLSITRRYGLIWNTLAVEVGRSMHQYIPDNAPGGYTIHTLGLNHRYTIWSAVSPPQFINACLLGQLLVFEPAAESVTKVVEDPKVRSYLWVEPMFLSAVHPSRFRRHAGGGDFISHFVRRW